MGSGVPISLVMRYSSTLGFYIGQLEAGTHKFEVEYSTDSEENVFEDVRAT